MLLYMRGLHLFEPNITLQFIYFPIFHSSLSFITVNCVILRIVYLSLHRSLLESSCHRIVSLALPPSTPSFNNIYEQTNLHC